MYHELRKRGTNLVCYRHPAGAMILTALSFQSPNLPVVFQSRITRVSQNNVAANTIIAACIGI